MRDINLGDTIYPKFTTRDFSTGAPFTLAGTPVLSVYEENNTTQITSGVSVSVDYDAVTGLNQATIVATAGNGYEAGKSYDVVITTGTVNGVSVVGEVVYSFTVEDSAAGLNATARAALEDQFDGTGLTGGSYPSTQEQISNIVSVGAAVNVPAESYVLTTGTQSANTYAATAALDGTRHEHTDSAGALDLYYQHDVTFHGVPTQATVVGYLVGGNDTVGVYAYNWAGTSWDQIGTIQGGAASNSTNTFALYTSHVGTGANVGKVRIRFYAASGLTTATLAIDQLFVSYAVVPEILHTDGTINDASATTTEFDTDLTEADNYWNDALLIFISGSLAGQACPISSFANTNGHIILDEALTSAPANGDIFLISYTHIHPVTQIADQVWDEVTSGHTTAGTTGKAMIDILADTNELQTDNIPALIAALNDPSAAAIASAVLNTQMSEDYAADGTAPTLLQAIYLIQQMLTEFAIAGTTWSVKGLDGTTVKATFTLDDGTNPTSITRAT